MAEEREHSGFGGEDFLKTMYDSCLYGVVQYYGNGRRLRIMGMNRMAEEIGGLDLPEHYFEENHVYIGLFTEDSYQETYIASIDSLTKPGDTVAYEDAVKKRNGETVWVMGEARLVSCEGGQKYIVCIFMDISKRKSYEETLRRERDKYNELFQNVPCAIVQYDYRNDMRHIRNFNNEVWRILNYKSREEYEETIKEGQGSQVFEADIPYTRMLFERMHKSNRPIDFVHRLVCRDGEVKWVYGRSELCCEQDGEEYYQGVFMDDTPRREEELKKENDYKAVISYMSGISEDTISRVRFNISDNKIELYKPREEAAIPDGDKMSYDEFANAAAERIVDEKEREQIRALMKRETIQQSFRKGNSFFEMEFRRRMQGDKMSWVAMQVRLVQEPNTKKLIGFGYLQTESRSSLKRLTAFERSYEALRREAQQAGEKMEELKKQGKTNSATFRQLLAKKVNAENTLKLFGIYGIED